MICFTYNFVLQCSLACLHCCLYNVYFTQEVLSIVDGGIRNILIIGRTWLYLKMTTRAWLGVIHPIWQRVIPEFRKDWGITANCDVGD